MKILFSIVTAAVLAGTCFASQEMKGTKLGTMKKKEIGPLQEQIAAQIPSYPLDKCIVSGDPLDAMGTPVDVIHEGKLVRLCCKGCKKALKQDAAKIVAKIDAAVVAQQQPGYPLDKCVVSGEALGSMGDPIAYVHGTRLVRLCCKGCVKGFQKEPAKYMASIDEALIQKQRATYPLKTCVVSGEALSAMGEPVDMLYGTRLVRLCCKGCVKGFKKEPAKYLGMLEAPKKLQKRG